MVVDGLVLVDKPAGKTSHDLALAVRRALGMRKSGHAGTLDPFATGLLLVLVGRARRTQRFLIALPKTYETVARLGALSTTGDPEGEIVETGRIPPAGATLPTGRILQRPPIWSAVHVQGRRAYARARDGERCRAPRARGDGLALRGALARGRPRRLRDRVLGRHLRTVAHRRARRRVLRGAAADARRTLHGAGRRSRARSASSATPWPSCRPCAWKATPRARAGHGVAVPGEAHGAAFVLLADDGGPIAVAEPRPGAELKPVVGFRG